MNLALRETDKIRSRKHRSDNLPNKIGQDCTGPSLGVNGLMIRQRFAKVLKWNEIRTYMLSRERVAYNDKTQNSPFHAERPDLKMACVGRIPSICAARWSLVNAGNSEQPYFSECHVLTALPITRKHEVHDDPDQTLTVTLHGNIIESLGFLLDDRSALDPTLTGM
jgi:hypothetical protein